MYYIGIARSSSRQTGNIEDSNMETTIAERTDIIGNDPDGLGAALQRVSHEREFPQMERRSKLGLREFKHEYLYRQKPVVCRVNSTRDVYRRIVSKVRA